MARIKNMKNAKKNRRIPGVLLKRLMGYIMKHYGAAFCYSIDLYFDQCYL